ncbi:hypothetical protein [Streptomyces bullii]|uniref:Uncharacterized protein n=1 Tax=Streptomyces bullii TaxID=349910 RepID=A0ABW0V350_9ACTN
MVRTLTGDEAPPAPLPVVSVTLGAVVLDEHVGARVVAGTLVVLT